ncbi:ATP-binding cassette domain-containing protein [Pseudomonas sp. SCPG-7]|uniref:ATP-binding cassette domain-containing protein n=1 Tax=Pseudomonas sp. SCPG-7 TaxID=1961714 RepID=UPI000A3A5F46|nr:ATP-binding cassette domain-containing protein [Pseudomonas sp. SCPG-7]
MKIAEFLKTVLWFRLPEPEKKRAAAQLHAHRWQRWSNAASRDARPDAETQPLPARIFAALKQDIGLALITIAVHTSAAFGAAITLKSLLAQLMQGESDIASNLTLGVTCMVLTYCAWLALNHTFFLAELVGIGSRSYVEQRLLRKKPALQKATAEPSLTSLFDREASRIESSWSGLITISLALATVIFTSTFFFYALGVSALAALAVIAISSMTVYWIARRLNQAYEALSLSATQRLEVGAFAVKNRRQAWLKNWTDPLIREYASKRHLEEHALKRAARLVAGISLVSSMTPIAALLSAALLQLAYTGQIDAPGVLAAIALIGGLRSVANNIPDIVQSLSQGVVGHKNIAAYLLAKTGENSPFVARQLPPIDARHIAIVGAAGSGKTSLLKFCAERLAHADGKALLIPDEPWIVEGGLTENLSVYGTLFTDEDVRDAFGYARLPKHFYLDYLNERRQGANRRWDVSRGQGKRLELARALIHRPQWVFIDQPTSGLDNDIATGLLQSMLSGPWRDTRVIFVTERPDEIAAAQQVWTLADGQINVSENQQPATLPGTASADESAFDSSPTSAQRSPADDPPPAATIRPLLDSLREFGIWKLSLVAFALLALKEIFTITGDYIIASGYMSSHLQASLIGLSSVLLISAVLSIGSALLTVRRTIDAATNQCLRYFSQLMNSGLNRQQQQAIDHDSQNKLTRDQRRVDEVLPVLLLETISALTLLSITTAYVVLGNPYVVLPFLIIGLIYWHSARQSDALLAHFNSAEIDSSGAVLSRVQALSWAGGRFDLAADQSQALDWLAPGLATRAFASLDNAATRRWYSYKLDLMGVLFLSGIIASTITIQAAGVVSTANVLAVSLSYSLIAIFARLGRCVVELRQVLASADRLIVSPARAPATASPVEASGAAALVAFRDVTFVNPASGVTVLEQFNQSFEPRDVVVIMGPSGVGKSTFANLVIGSLLPSAGQISTLGGTDGYLSRRHSQEVRLLTSNPVFKPGLLSDHFNRPSPEALQRGVHLLGLTDVVERLQNGFDQHIPWSGELGLSKSELQRLALLDLTLSAPTIAILDEATSEMSSTEEVELIGKVVRALPQTLFFIITHNPDLCELGNRTFNFNHQRRLVEQPA